VVVWSLGATLLLATTLRPQEVRLPLERFHELERLARESTPAQRPAAPFVLERATLEIVIANDRATIVERLDLVVSDDNWQRLDIPSPGRWIAIELGTLEGRLDDEGRVLVFRGAGQHTVELSAVAAVQELTRFGRTEWAIVVGTPAAGMVVGSARSELTGDGGGGPVLEVVSGAVALAPPGADGILRFAARPAASVAIVVRSDQATPASTVEAVVDLDAISLARVRPTRLTLLDQLLLHVVRGEVSEIRLDLPAGSTTSMVRGPAVAGWRVEGDGQLVIAFDPALTATGIAPTPIEIARDQPLVDSTVAATESNDAVVRTVTITAETPRLAIARTARSVFALEAEADGIVTLLEAGASRSLSASIAADLRDRLPPAARRSARLLADSAPADSALADTGVVPRWEVAWPDATQVLAATIDVLTVDWLWGASGAAGLRVSARVRSSGLEVLELELPATFELTVARLEGAAIEPGRRGNLLAIPLRVDSESQLVTLEGVVSGVARPADGGVLELTVPAASAPISRVDVRGVLDGRYAYRLLDAERLETGGGRRIAPPQDWEWPVPPGHVTVDAAWGALSTRPGPLRLEVRSEPKEATWY
jgi:hypothetical protein